MVRKKNAVRKDGLIPKQIYLGRDENGKRITKTVYGKTQKEADAKKNELEALLKKGVDILAANDSFGTWATKWLNWKRARSKDKLYATHNTNVAKFEAIWDKPISKIMVSDIEAIIDPLAESSPASGKPLSKKTLESILGTARQVFEYACTSKALTDNPCEKVTLPLTKAPQKRRALTPEEQQWILDTEHRAKRAAMIMMYSGLRRGELIALLWTDINLEEGTISVTKSVESDHGQLKLKDGAKSEYSIRVVDIPSVLTEYLRNETRDSFYVCTNAKRGMHTDQSWKNMWDSYLTEINCKYGRFINKPKSKFDPNGVPFVIPRFTAHWLRHTFCTLMYLAGVDLLTAQQQMGHADIRTTLAIYSHLDKIHKRKSMMKLDNYLSDSGSIQVNET